MTKSLSCFDRYFEAILERHRVCGKCGHYEQVLDRDQPPAPYPYQCGLAPTTSMKRPHHPACDRFVTNERLCEDCLHFRVITYKDLSQSAKCRRSRDIVYHERGISATLCSDWEANTATVLRKEKELQDLIDKVRFT